MAKAIYFKGLNGIRATVDLISYIFVAYLSFHFFEKRFILLKDKFSTVKSTA